MGSGPARARRLICLGLAVASFNWACSWHFMQPLPADAPPSEVPDCSTNWLARMDGILAGAFAAAAGGAVLSYATREDSYIENPYPESYLGAAGAYGVTALIFTASAITVAVWASRCDDQFTAHRGWLKQGNQPLPRPDAPVAPATALSDGRACPEGAHAHGQPPPASLAHGCVLPGPGGEPVNHGPHTTWYESGVKASEGEYRHGKRHGPWTYWYPDGSRKLEAHYHRGNSVGQWTFWDQQGEIFKEADLGPIPEPE